MWGSKKQDKPAVTAPAAAPSRHVDLAVNMDGLEDLQQRRLTAALNYVRSTIDSLDAWVTDSKEVSNYTYNLTPLARKQLAAAVAVALDRPYAEIEGYITELENDRALAETIVKRSESDRYFDTHDHSALFGRRMGWYAVARALKPKIIIETGVDKGLGSMTMAAALLRNEAEGHPGRYFGTDIVPGAGFLLCEPYARVAQLLIGDSIESLKAFDQPIDLFINDSDHSAQYEADEYDVIESKLSDRAVVLGDNSHVTDALLNFANRTNRSFLFYREVPLKHWYPGAGIGIAFKKKA